MLALDLTLVALEVGDDLATYSGTIAVTNGPDLRFHVADGLTEWATIAQAYPQANIPTAAYGLDVDDDAPLEDIERERSFVQSAEAIATSVQASYLQALRSLSSLIVADVNKRTAA